MVSHRHDVSFLGSDPSILPKGNNLYPQLKPHWTKKHFRKIISKIAKKYDDWSYISQIKQFPAEPPYIYKQFKPHWTRKHLRHIIPKIAKKFDVWSYIDYTKKDVTIQPYLLKQFIPHWKHRARTHRYFTTRKVSPQYDAWKTTTQIPVTIYGFVLQPWLLKQLIPKWKFRFKTHRFFKASRVTPPYKVWRASVPIPPILPTLAVNISPPKTMNIKVIKTTPQTISSNVPK